MVTLFPVEHDGTLVFSQTDPRIDDPTLVLNEFAQPADYPAGPNPILGRKIDDPTEFESFPDERLCQNSGFEPIRFTIVPNWRHYSEVMRGGQDIILVIAEDDVYSIRYLRLPSSVALRSVLIDGKDLTQFPSEQGQFDGIVGRVGHGSIQDCRRETEKAYCDPDSDLSKAVKEQGFSKAPKGYLFIRGGPAKYLT